MTTSGDFERFVRAASRPAETRGLPEPAGPPTPEQVAALAELAAESSIASSGRRSARRALQGVAGGRLAGAVAGE